MDRFKFRVWNYSRQIMEHADLQIRYMQEKGIYSYDENFHMMQCTGIKDCQGELIYEADVIALEEEDRYGERTWSGKYYVYWAEVEWAFQDECGDGYTFCDLYLDPDTFKIIGNICQDEYKELREGFIKLKKGELNATQ